MDDSQFGHEPGEDLLGAVGAAVLGHDQLRARQFGDDLALDLADLLLDCGGLVVDVDDDADGILLGHAVLDLLPTFRTSSGNPRASISYLQLGGAQRGPGTKTSSGLRPDNCMFSRRACPPCRDAGAAVGLPNRAFRTAGQASSGTQPDK